MPLGTAVAVAVTRNHDGKFKSFQVPGGKQRCPKKVMEKPVDPAAIVPSDLLQLIPQKYRGAALIGNSEDEIARWKADRRRNFPTEETLARKRQLREVQEHRGQLSETHPAGAMHKRLHRAAPRPEGDAAPGEEAPAAAAAGEEEVEGEGGGAGGDGAALDAPEELSSGREALLIPDTRLGVVQVPCSEGAGGAGAGGGGGRDTRPLCTAWKTKGRCRFGSSCRFSHGATQPSSSPGSQPEVCRWYLLGVCTAGKRCPYQHALAGAAPGASGSEATGLLRRLLAKDVQREASMVLQGIRALVKRYGDGSAGLPTPGDPAAL